MDEKDDELSSFNELDVDLSILDGEDKNPKRRINIGPPGDEAVDSFSDDFFSDDVSSDDKGSDIEYWRSWYHKNVSSKGRIEKIQSYLGSTTARSRALALNELTSELLFFLSAHDTSKEKGSVKAFVICSLFNVPFFRSFLSLVLGKSPTLLIETDAMASERERLMNQVANKLFGDDDPPDWYTWVEKKSGVELKGAVKFLIGNLRKPMLDADAEALAVEIFFRVDRISDDESLEDFLNRNIPNLDFGSSLEKSEILKLALRKKVIGQDQAITDLCDAYAQSLLQENNGPRGIFTLMGEPGTGKTFLVEAFSEAISAVEGEPYHFLKFNMEQYSHENGAMSLFGTGNFYHQPALGLLTDPVRNYPKVVILFDEIEKAHPAVIQSLLGILDRGEAKDSSSLRVSNFKHSYIFFTTNLGNEALITRRESDQVFDTLNQSSLPRLLTKKPIQSDNSLLTPEFVSRLSKGQFLVFEPLLPEHLVSIYINGWEKQSKSGAIEHIPDPRLSMEVAVMSVLTRIPDFSARVAVNAAEKDCMVSRKFMVEFDRSQDQEITRTYRESHFSGVHELLNMWMSSRNLDTPLRLLMIDDDETTANFLTEELAHREFPVEITKASNSDFLETNHRNPIFDVVLVDLFIDNDVSQRKLSTAFDEIRRLQQSEPTALIYGFCRNPRNSVLSSRALDSAQHIKGIQAVFTYNEASKKSFVNEICEKLRLHFYSRLVKAFQRERKRVNLQWYISHTNDCLYLSPILVNVEPIVVLGDDNMQELGKIPDLSLSDVIGNERGVSQIEKAIGWLKNSGRVGRYGFRPPSGYLLAGPPGTGKTFLAKAAAGECGLPFLSINSTELLASTQGTGETRLREVFKKARELAPSIIFIDEIDTIAIDRNRSGSHRGLINTLLSEMDGFSSHVRPVLVLAATNYPEMLDSALKRPGRLDEIIVCDLPNTSARTVMIQRGLKKLDLSASDLQMDELVQRSQGCSAAAIDAAIRQAVYIADSEDRDPEYSDVSEAFQLSVYGIVRSDLKLAQAEKWAVACHEAGHALAIKFRYPDHRIDYISIQPRTDSLGFVSYRENSSNAKGSLSRTRIEVKADLDIALAGREAERLMLGEDGMSTGASQDLNRANFLVRRVVMQSGLDSEIGTLFLTDELLSTNPILAEKCVQRCRAWLEESEIRVSKLLTSKKSLLTVVAEYLFEHESIEGPAFEKLLKLVNQD